MSVEWVRRRRLGFARVDGRFVDIGHSSTMAELRPTFLSAALACGLQDFDAAAIRAHALREFAVPESSLDRSDAVIVRFPRQGGESWQRRRRDGRYAH